MKSKFLLLFLLLFLFCKDSLSKEKINILLDKIEPYTILENNKLYGVNSELINLFFDPINYDIEIHYDNKNNTKYDILGLKEENYTENNNFIASKKIFDTYNIIFSSENNKLKSIDEIKNDKVGVLKNSLISKEIKDKFMFLNEYTKINDLIKDLEEQKIKYAITEKSIFEYNNKKNQFFINLDKVLDTSLVFYISKEKDKLLTEINSKIEFLKNKKELENISNKYFALNNQKNYLLYSIYIFLAILIVSILLILIIRFKTKYYQLEISGNIFIKMNPYSENFLNYRDYITDFEKKFSSFKLKYNRIIDFKINTEDNALKIFINSYKTYLKNEKIIEEINDDLSELFEDLDSDAFFININISGILYNLLKISNFTITNHKNKVGIHIDSKNKYLSEAFFELFIPKVRIIK